MTTQTQPKPKKKWKTRKITSLVEHVREVTGDDAFADALAAKLAARRVTRLLSVLRNLAGLSQEELAAKLTCTQSRVSKLESADDADVRLGDLASYAAAVGYDLGVVLTPSGQSLVDAVRLHLSALKPLVEQLAARADATNPLPGSIASFVEQMSEAISTLLQATAATLRTTEPKRDGAIPVHWLTAESAT